MSGCCEVKTTGPGECCCGTAGEREITVKIKISCGPDSADCCSEPEAATPGKAE